MQVALLCQRRVRADAYLICTGIGEADWSFKTMFNVTEQELRAPNVDLVFDGLDTFSSISLVSFYY